MNYKFINELDGYQPEITNLENKICDLDRFIRIIKSFWKEVCYSKDVEECQPILDSLQIIKKMVNRLIVWLSPYSLYYIDVNNLSDLTEYQKIIVMLELLWEVYEDFVTKLANLDVEDINDNKYKNFQLIVTINREKLIRLFPEYNYETYAVKFEELEKKEKLAKKSYYLNQKLEYIGFEIEYAIYNLDSQLIHIENQKILTERVEWTRTHSRRLKHSSKNSIKIYFKRRGFLPLSWDINPPILPCPSVAYIPVPKEIIEEALNYRPQKLPPISSYDEAYDLNFKYVMRDLFDLERQICFRNQSLIGFSIESIISWIDENIESNRYEEGQYIIEQAYELYEKIFYLEESDFTDFQTLKSLVECVDEFAASVCTYYGVSFDKVKEDIGYNVSAALEYLCESEFHLNEECEDIEFTEGITEDYDINESENEYADEQEFSYDDEYPFFEITGLKVVNYMDYIILSMNLSFEPDAGENSVVIPVAITTKNQNSYTSNSYNQVHKFSDGVKHLSSFLIMNAKTKSDLCEMNLELTYYTSEMKLCTALYKCDRYGNFIFMDWKNRRMTSKEIDDYNNRLMNNTEKTYNLYRVYTEKEIDTLNKHIKNDQLFHVYLLYGEERYVINIYRNKLLQAMLGTSLLDKLSQDKNFTLFSGTSFDTTQLIETALTSPVLDGKRVILIEDCNINSNKSEELIYCLKNLPSTTYIIFVENNKFPEGELFSAIKEVGCAVEINEQQKVFVENWIIKKLSSYGKRITRAALDTLFEHTGINMTKLNEKTDELITYKEEDTDIKVKDVLAVLNRGLIQSDSKSEKEETNYKEGAESGHNELTGKSSIPSIIQKNTTEERSPMTLYRFLIMCDKKTRILLTQDGKRIFMDKKIGQETAPFFAYPVLGITHKNQQLRIAIGKEKIPLNIMNKEEIYLKDIMPLLEDGEELALSKELADNVKKPIENIKLSPLDILIIS